MHILALSAPADGANMLALTAPEADLTGAPEIVKILPRGHVTSRKGDFDVTDDSYRDIVDYAAAHGVDIVIDYEHQTLGGGQAPAAGWVRELLLQDDAIAARVEWTPQAAKFLRAKEYRYLSPVVHLRPDGIVRAITSIALTNVPAIDGMYAVVNSAAIAADDDIGKSEKKEEDKEMEWLAKLLVLLGLDPGATPEAAMAAVEKLQAQAKAADTADKKAAEDTTDKVVANSIICGLLGIDAGAKTEAAAAAIMALKADNTAKNAEQMVALAMHAGKITGATRDWALDYAQRDPAGFKAFTAVAPGVVPMGEMVPDTAVPCKADAQMDDMALAVCGQLGVSADDINTYGGAK